jgi:hypothetical protein
VTYTLSEGAVGPFTLVGPLATMTLNSSDRSNPLPLSFVASAASGTHNYHLQVASATATGAIVDVTNVTLSAVDLGN